MLTYLLHIYKPLYNSVCIKLFLCYLFIYREIILLLAAVIFIKTIFSVIVLIIIIRKWAALIQLFINN